MANRHFCDRINAGKAKVSAPAKEKSERIMKSYRERFIKNHRKEMQIAGNKKGYRNVLVYIGDYYTWEPEKGTIQSVRRIFLILEILTVILFSLSSIPGTVISYSPLAMSAALLSLVAWAFEVFAIVSLCIKKLPLQEDDFSYINRFFRVTTAIRCVFLLFAVVTGILYMADKGFETTGILAVIGYFLTAAIALLLFLMYMKLAKCKKVIPGEATREAESR